MSKKHKKRQINLSRKAKIVIAASTVGVVIVGLVVFLLVLINQSQSDPVLTDEQKSQRDNNVNEAKRDSSLRQSASDALKKGDTARAEQIYKDAIDSETETARKVQLYVDQSRLLYSSGKAEDAIKVAKIAESQTDDKFMIADWLARLYEDQKQYALAAQYFTIARDSVNSPNNIYLFDKAHYDAQIARVNALGAR